MKICLYLEFYNFWGGIFFKNIGTGLLSSYENQKIALHDLRIEFSEKWDDSCDILQINTPWLKSLWFIKKAKHRGKKVIIWSHVTVEDFKQVFRFNKYLAPLMKKYLKYIYGLADLVFCPSEYTKSLLVAYGLSAEKLVVQSNGVNLKIFYADQKKRKKWRKKYGYHKTVIGTVGLVIPRKGIDTFLAMAEKFPEYEFVWFGKIYNKIMVKSLPKILPSNVKFTGFVQDSLAAFNIIDIFIFPSYEENQGMVILEAAAVGLPIIVRDILTYVPWLKNNENCLKAKNDEEFAICIKNLISDSKLKTRLRQGALILAQNECIKVLNRKLFSTYQDLLK